MSAPCAGAVSGAQLPAPSFRRCRLPPRRPGSLHRGAALPGSSGPPGRPGGGLILPGSEGFPGAGLPGGAPRRPGGFGPSSGQAPPRDGPLYQPFRPPPAYKDTASQSKDEMLNKLTTRAGRWFDLAKVLDTLHAQGVQNTDVFEITGIPQVTQNLWKVQASVYFSLAADETFPPDLLSFFHSEDAASTLAELRTVPASWRSAVAVFVAQRSLGVDGARELARAVVDVDRGRPPGDGFDPTPGDALAAKIWRDAGEVRRRGEWEKEVVALVERGLGVATSDKAKAKLRERLAEASQSAPSDTALGGSTSGPEVVVQVVRLETEESAFLPVALLGSLDDITPGAVKAAPSVVLEGVFNTFKPAGGTSWVALPAWAKLAALSGLFAVFVPETKRLAAVSQLRASPGPALLVFDRNAVTPSPKSYYLVARPSSLLVDAAGKNSLQRMELLPGGEVAAIKGATVCGQLLVACRPPLPSSETHEAKFADDDDMAANFQGTRPFAGANAVEVDFPDE